MAKLTEPSKELAKRLLHTELGFDEQLIGIRLHPMAGSIECPIYSFPEAARFMHVDSLEVLASDGGKGQVNYIDLEVLQRWLSEVFGDTELSQAIEEVVEKTESFGEAASQVKELLEQRMVQCHAALEENLENKPEKSEE